MRNVRFPFIFSGKSLNLICSSDIAPPGPKKLFPRSQRKKMKYAATLLLALFAGVSIIFLIGCGNDYSPEAVEKMTDQELLAKVAVESEDPHARKAAVEKLTDQATLAKVAQEDKEFWVRRAAVEKLTDQILLAKIAIDDEYMGVRETAVKELMDQAAQGKTAVHDKDWRVSIFYMIIQAFDSVSIDYDSAPKDHKVSLITNVLPAFSVLNDPAVASVIGEILSVKIDWQRTQATYIGESGGVMHGERYTCSISVKNLIEPLSHTWSTSFPETAYLLGFCSADVNAADLLGPVFDLLSQDRLADFALKDKNEGVRQAAVEKITDQDMSSKIAMEDTSELVCQAAVKNLTDQKLLLKIYLEAKTLHARNAANNRLNALRRARK